MSVFAGSTEGAKDYGSFLSMPSIISKSLSYELFYNNFLIWIILRPVGGVYFNVFEGEIGGVEQIGCFSLMEIDGNPE